MRTKRRAKRRKNTWGPAWFMAWAGYNLMPKEFWAED